MVQIEEFSNKIGLLILLFGGLAVAAYAVVYFVVYKFTESKKISNFLGGIIFIVALYFALINILLPALH